MTISEVKTCRPFKHTVSKLKFCLWIFLLATILNCFSFLPPLTLSNHCPEQCKEISEVGARIYLYFVSFWRVQVLECILKLDQTMLTEAWSEFHR